MKKTILLSIILLISILSYSQIIEELGTWEYGPTEAIAVKDSTAYISSGSYLWVLDISDESNPTLIDEIRLENYINYIRRIGNYLYVTKEDTLLNIYDIHTSNNPVLANQLEGYYKWDDLSIYNDTIFLGRQSHVGVLQYHINDTINPQYIRWIWNPDKLTKYSDIGIGLKSQAIRLYDLTIAGDIFTYNGFINFGEVIRGSAINYPYIYFGYGSEGIGVAEIINVDSIIEQGSYLTGGSTYDVELIEDTILIAARGLNGIGIYDIDNDT
ncbi:beta-propeller domain-containing protein, partial [candidate division WOR-3 bacterium]|nr:beta-propeller domain-containing protein [candidate division WOR-3 bacterium]